MAARRRPPAAAAAGGVWPDDPAEVLRHLSTIEVNLDQYEVEVRSILPSRSTPLGETTSNLVRTLEVAGDPALRRAIDRLVAAVKAALVEPDPEQDPDRCDRCVRADCCEFAHIFLSRAEARRILDHLGEEGTALARYFQPADDLAGHYELAFRRRGGRCIFLKRRRGQMRCSIYEARPRVCREFDAGACRVHTELKRRRPPR